MTIGSQLVELRKKAKLSQEQMAEKLGITRQTLSKYENDITYPDLYQAKKIAEVLNISLDELIGNDKTISSKISITERLVKKQTKNTKILLITIYFIILIILIFLTIYWSTKKDYTKEFQTEFTCSSKEDNSYINYYLDVDYSNEEEIMQNYYITSHRCDNNNDCYDEKMYAGDSIGEAINSLIFVKKVMLGNDYICR